MAAVVPVGACSAEHFDVCMCHVLGSLLMAAPCLCLTDKSLMVSLLPHLPSRVPPSPFPSAFSLLAPAAVLQCDQDQCIQSTKFVLQAAATPLLQSEPSLTSEELHMPGKPGLGTPCASLTLGQPTPPSSMPNLATEATLSDIMPLKDEHGGHQFLTPDEAPSPPRMLGPGSPLAHSRTMHILDLASQDSLHEDSVRGLVKLSSV